MQINFYKPRNKILSQYIESYYFMSPDGQSEELRYLTFPNNYTIFSVAYGGVAKVEGDSIIIKKDESKEVDSHFIGRYIRPIQVIYKDEILELTIYFKPLGINNFVKEDLAGKNLEHYIPYADSKSFFEHLLLLSNRENQIDELEWYLLSKFVEDSVCVVSDILKDLDAGLSISESAKRHNITRQYLSKIFQSRLGKSPSEYKRVLRFRTAIAQQRHRRNLTELSMESLFYDQSHFIKDFKEITGHSPKIFFKNVDTLKENIWLFV